MLYFEKNNELKVRERPRKTIVYLYMLNTDNKNCQLNSIIPRKSFEYLGKPAEVNTGQGGLERTDLFTELFTKFMKIRYHNDLQCSFKSKQRGRL